MTASAVFVTPAMPGHDPPEPHEATPATPRGLRFVFSDGKRGKARKTVQLSADQKRIIDWIVRDVAQRVTARTGRRRHGAAAITTVPVRWHAKRCFADEEFTPARRAAASRSLKRLLGRGLVLSVDEVGNPRPGRVTYLRLSMLGWVEYLGRPVEQGMRKNKNAFYGRKDS